MAFAPVCAPGTARQTSFMGAADPLSSRLTFSAPRFPTRPNPAILPPLSMCAPGSGIYTLDAKPSDIRVVVFGATGYIGRFVAREMAQQGYRVVAFARSRSGVGGKDNEETVRKALGEGVSVVFGDVTDPESTATAFASGAEPGDLPPPLATVAVSCLASRSGGVEDSNRIDYGASVNVLNAARAAGAKHYVLLSAICVQKPLLEFQRAKLRLEAEIEAAAKEDEEFSYSIVRPTAFFKSLAAQVDRMKKGGSYIMFNDGELCKCNALSERDLARFMALCVRDPAKRNQILPVGGPGEAVTPKEQAKIVFDFLGREEKYTSVPIGIMDGAISFLAGLAKLLPPLQDPAEFARIGRYYATEDMVGPQFGEDTLEDFFASALKDGGMEGQDLGEAKYF